MRRFVVVCEGKSDFRYASELADRLFKNAYEWLRDALPQGDPLDYNREWCGHDGLKYFRWSQLDDVRTRLKLPKRLGHFQNEPGRLDASSTRNALHVIDQCFRDAPVHGILLLRDADKVGDERKAGAEQAVSEQWKPKEWVIISAVVRTKIECWVLAGFQPKPGTHEPTALESLCRKLGFNPVKKAHLLTAGDEGKKSAKAALRELTGDDVDRQRECWSATDLEVLKANGAEAGLGQFIDDVQSKWCPLLAK